MYILKSLRRLFLIIVMGLVVISCSESEKKQKPAREVTFACAENQMIQAGFAKHSVQLELSDSRSLNLSHTRSASGARYTNKDESIVFWNKGNTAFLMEGDSMTYRDCVVKGEDDLVNLESFQDKDSVFVLRYPKVFKQNRVGIKDTSGWSYASTKKGELAIQLTSLPSYQSKTNLSEATVTVGWSDKPAAQNGCLDSPQAANIMHVDTVALGQVPFVRSYYAEAGAGNFYQVRQYRVLKNRRCYSIEERVHSTNIHNYPPERGITEFDSVRVWKVLNTAVNTFAFTD